MKSIRILTAALLSAGIAIAQGSAPQPQSGAPAPAQGQAQGQTQPQAPAGPKKKQAKSQQEYQDFMALQGAATGVAAEAQAKQFEQKYPTSELRDIVASVVMGKYRTENNEDKTLEWGRQALTFEPNNVQALLLSADVLAHTTHKLDLDRDQKIAELNKNAKRAIELIEAGALTEQGATPEQSKNAEAIAYSAMGHGNAAQEDFQAAEPSLRKAIELQGAEADPVTLLDLAVALDHLGKYQDALPFATKAAQAAATTAGYEQIGASAKSEQDRLQKLTAAGPASPAATATPSTQPKPMSNR